MKIYTILSFLVVIYLCSCADSSEKKSNDSNEQQAKQDTVSVDTLITDTIVEVIEEEPVIDSLEQVLIDFGLVNIQDVDSNIQVDLKYSTVDNFMEMDMYGSLTNAYLQPDVAAKLAKSQKALKDIDSTLNLLVYDGVRPRSVQWTMWKSLDLPIKEKVKFVSNPKNGSLHNFGAAVDLTIADAKGIALDMGAGYDDIRKIAYPRHEKAYLDSGMLTKEHISNRDMLRKVMRKGGFWNIATEWWHFNSCRRDSARVWYKIVE